MILLLRKVSLIAQAVTATAPSSAACDNSDPPIAAPIGVKPRPFAASALSTPPAGALIGSSLGHLTNPRSDVYTLRPFRQMILLQFVQITSNL